jgi:DNA repair exonuclease SbcCD nuclease subunit
MKILHLADLHFVALYKLLGIHNAFIRYKLLIREILKVVDKEKPEIIVISGDVYNNYNPTSWESPLFTILISQFHKRGITTLVISGNHDSEGLTGINTLRYLLPLAPRYNVIVTLTNVLIQIVKGITFILWPFGVYPSPADLVEIKSYPKPRIGVMHTPIYGSKITADGKRLTSGFKLSSAIETVNKLGLSYLLLGDIHEYQKLSENIFYPGAPLQTRFSEGVTKGLISIDLNKEASTFIPLETPHKLLKVNSIDKIDKKSFVHFDVSSTEHAFDILPKLPDNVVKISYTPNNLASYEGTEDSQIGWEINLQRIIFEGLQKRSVSNPTKYIDYLVSLVERKKSS